MLPKEIEGYVSERIGEQGYAPATVDRQQGVPLETYDTVLNYISNTRTSAGLTVAVKLNSKTYQKGQEVTDQEIKLLSIRRHRTLPEWHYTIKPYHQNRLRKL